MKIHRPDNKKDIRPPLDRPQFNQSPGPTTTSITRMSANPTTPGPELAAILATLAGLNPNNNSQPPPQPSNWAPEPEPPNHYFLHQNHPHPQQQWPPVESVPRAEPKRANLIDPATITEWSVGLRCVMKTVSVHDQILKDIRKVRSHIFPVTGYVKLIFETS